MDKKTLKLKIKTSFLIPEERKFKLLQLVDSSEPGKFEKLEKIILQIKGYELELLNELIAEDPIFMQRFRLFLNKSQIENRKQMELSEEIEDKKRQERLLNQLLSL